MFLSFSARKWLIMALKITVAHYCGLGWFQKFQLDADSSFLKPIQSIQCVNKFLKMSLKKRLECSNLGLTYYFFLAEKAYNFFKFKFKHWLTMHSLLACIYAFIHLFLIREQCFGIYNLCSFKFCLDTVYVHLAVMNRANTCEN